MNDEKRDSSFEMVPMLIDPTLPEEEQKIIKKQNKIAQLFFDPKTNFPDMLMQFFDFDSEKMLDEKIAVLTEMQNGKSYADIPHFYDILELWTEGHLDGTIHWD